MYFVDEAIELLYTMTIPACRKKNFGYDVIGPLTSSLHMFSFLAGSLEENSVYNYID